MEQELRLPTEDLSFFSLFVYALRVSVSAIFRLYLGTNGLFAILTVCVWLFLGTNELFLRCVYVCFWELMSYSYSVCMFVFGLHLFCFSFYL